MAIGTACEFSEWATGRYHESAAARTNSHNSTAIYAKEYRRIVCFDKTTIDVEFKIEWLGTGKSKTAVGELSEVLAHKIETCASFDGRSEIRLATLVGAVN